jgi:hypothetical protein
MFAVALLFGGVAAFAIAATLVQLRRDGYRRLPVRTFTRLP